MLSLVIDEENNEEFAQLEYSFSVLGNRSAYIVRTGWRESSLLKFIVD
jgi:hypothetical protein